MAIYTSNLVKKLHRHRGIYSGKDYDVAGRIFLAEDTVLTTADDLLFVPVGENQVITKVTLLVVGDTSTIAGSIGTFQILDTNGDPVVVRRRGPNSNYLPAGNDFPSPATSAASLKAAGQLDGYTETIIAAPTKLTGPTNVGIRITTGGTIAADTELFLAVYFDGETSTQEVTGGYPAGPLDYLLD
jgi:hypothetical protein